MPDESVHCVVTSPPYFGLRDYGTASWHGGDPACTHQEVQPSGREGRETPGGRGGSFPTQERGFKRICGRCGANRADQQIGLEPTPAEFVAVLVEVFREVRRVLRKDGTLWLNLGDSYGTGASGGSVFDNGRTDGRVSYEADKPRGRIKVKPGAYGVKPKDLMGIPWRVAFALQADGWYLRQDIIWAKPNPMPESVTDRCTKAHEYLFLLSKSPRYHYDAEAIAELAMNTGGGEGATPDKAARAGITSNGTGNSSLRDKGAETRNRRSVWTVATAPYSEAHFATFPPALIEPCILAGCPKGGTVLDPFGGAGTTGLVADRLQRDAILIELNEQYAAMAGDRITDDAPLFAEVAAHG
jgi:DNA modification methylase